VILKPEVSHMMVSTEETTTFMAQLSPRLAGQGKVLYKLYRSDREDLVTGDQEGRFPINFDTAGRYLNT